MRGVLAAMIRHDAGAQRRAAGWWAAGLATFVVVNLAFWPSLDGNDALAAFDDMDELMAAFGAQNIATPTGYVDGQLFAFLVPMLFSAMMIMAVAGATAGDESSGRLELVHALPVTRRAVWLSRWAGASIALCLVGVVTAVVTVAGLRPFGLEEVGVGRVLAATLGCGLLAALHGAIAFASAGLGASKPQAAGAAFAILIAGYLADFVLPIAEALVWARQWSPWYWAIGTQPVHDGVDWPWMTLLVAITCALLWLGAAAVDRRDVHSA